VDRDFVIRRSGAPSSTTGSWPRGSRSIGPSSTPAPAYIDRILMDRIGRLAFGDAFVKVRDAENDAQLMKAAEIIRQGGTRQADIFGYVEQVKRGRAERPRGMAIAPPVGTVIP
jgi:hypothetical protein